MAAQHPDQVTLDRLAMLGEVFRPAGPITTQDLFAGRLLQLGQVLDLCGESGRHGVIFGERGVGKTSLAAVATALLQQTRGRISLRINCDANDDFARAWQKVGDELCYLARTSEEPLQGALEDACQWLNESELSPDVIRQAMRRLGEVTPAVIFFDEFDRIRDGDSRRLFSDMIKTLSDQLVPVTVIVVGVADDVDALIAEHSSVQRAVAQVRMPRMDRDEIEAIIEKGLSALDFRAEGGVRRDLVDVPKGLPHYAHLLAQETLRHAILRGETVAREADFAVGVREALAKADQSMARAYHDATASARHTILEEVLIACALADTDTLGYFAPSDVRDPLSRIMGTRYEIPQFANHLALFCNDRGPVLERKGGERRWRYRFRDPMMQPYAVIRGLDSGKLVPSGHGGSQ